MQVHTSLASIDPHDDLNYVYSWSLHPIAKDPLDKKILQGRLIIITIGVNVC